MPAPAPEEERLPFLGPAWLEALAAAAAEVALPADVCLTLQQVVTGGDGEDIRYHLVARDGRLSVRPGQAPDPDLTLTQPYEVAAALSRGDTKAQLAL